MCSKQSGNKTPLPTLYTHLHSSAVLSTKGGSPMSKPPFKFTSPSIRTDPLHDLRLNVGQCTLILRPWTTHQFAMLTQMHNGQAIRTYMYIIGTYPTLWAVWVLHTSSSTCSMSCRAYIARGWAPTATTETQPRCGNSHSPSRHPEQWGHSCYRGWTWGLHRLTQPCLQGAAWEGNKRVN